MPIKIKIIVDGGVVQTVYSTNKDIEVELLDLDETDSFTKAEAIKKKVADLETDGDFTEILVTSP